MKVSCLLLLLCSLPIALCRLNSQSEGQMDSDIYAEQPQLRALNLTNEISYFRGNGHQVIEVIEPEYDESPPEVLTNVTFDFLPTPALANVDSHRELQSTMEVVIENQCTTPFYFSIKYNQGSVTKGWYILQYEQSISFEVQGNQFAMYATSSDGAYRWQGQAGSANYCDGSICYKDYTIDGSPTRSIHYLRCISSGTPGPSPTPPPPTPPPPTPDQSETRNRGEELWVDAHNTRRARLHDSLVSWHSGIADSAQSYASKLAAIDGCVIQHGYQGDIYGGENLAANWGRSAISQSPDQVLTRWFENEENLIWPANGHWSQVGWRATKHIGCGEVQKSYQGGTCFIQVCRYITPGNCNVGSAPLNELMLQEISPCKPSSP